MRFWPGGKKNGKDIAVPLATVAQFSAPVRAIPRKRTAKPGKLKITDAVRKRFEDYLDKRNRKCWGWKGSCTSDGYGQFWLNDFKVVKAHRFAYEIYVRKLSAKERLRNICNGKSCMNPACWEAFTTGQRHASAVKNKATPRRRA